MSPEYAAAFADLERAVKSGASRDEIRRRFAIVDEILDRERSRLPS
jgi:hypothetical protein